MKRFKNLVIGGIETKIFNLILITVLLIAAVFLAMTLIHGKMLRQLSEETGQRQREAITDITDDVMDQVVEQSMGEISRLRADVSDKMFSDLKDRVEMLAEYAEKNLETAQPEEDIVRPEETLTETAAQLPYEEAVPAEENESDVRDSSDAGPAEEVGEDPDAQLTRVFKAPKPEKTESGREHRDAGSRRETAPQKKEKARSSLGQGSPYD